MRSPLAQVRVASEKAAEEKFLEGRSTRKAAVAPACKLIGQGIEGVTLMDEDGRVCRGIQCMIDAFVRVPGRRRRYLADLAN